MTIKRLSNLLKARNVPFVGRSNDKDTSTPFYLNSLHGVRVAVEASGIIYKQNAGAANRVIDMHEFTYDNGWSRPSEDEVLNMFRNFYRGYMTRLVGSGMIPVVIIEGRGPEMKSGTLQQRTMLKANNEEKVETARTCMDLEAYKKRLRNSYFPTSAHVNVAIEEMRKLNITMVRAHREAEGVCAKLVIDKNDPLHCSCAIIDDYDIFMYGCTVVVRNLRTASERVGGFEGTAYTHLDVLDKLDLIKKDDDKIDMSDYHMASRRFKVLCILSGTDYHPNIKGIGCVKILNLMLGSTVDVVQVTDDKGSFTVHPHILGLEKIRDSLASLPDVVRSCPSAITRWAESTTERPVNEEYSFVVGEASAKRIDTYEEMCLINPDFKTIPYHEINKTLRDNMGYTAL